VLSLVFYGRLDAFDEDCDEFIAFYGDVFHLSRPSIKTQAARLLNADGRFVKSRVSPCLFGKSNAIVIRHWSIINRQSKPRPRFYSRAIADCRLLIVDFSSKKYQARNEWKSSWFVMRPLIQRGLLALSIISSVVLIVGLMLGAKAVWQPAAVVLCFGLAIGLGGTKTLAGFQFTAWIITAVTAAMIYPHRLLYVGPVDLRNPWIILLVVQAVMFGMSTQMTLQDFAGVAKMPWGVGVGIVCQFTIMPLVGFTLTRLFAFPGEIAAGVVLIGSCSSGLASNVMVYLARGNLALSITLTSVATLMAPLVTPLWMKILAGTLVDISFVKMMMDIIKIVIVPVGAGLLHDYLKHASRRGKRIVWTVTVLSGIWLLMMAAGGWENIVAQVNAVFVPWIGLWGFLLGACVAGTLYHAIWILFPDLDRRMPLASMFGIVYFTAVTTAAGRDSLLELGALLFLAAVIHNGLGYCLGYALSRALRLNRTDARTVALEVGLQNGGMASGLAGAMGKLGTVGLAAAIFSPWMNISGSVLANYWRRHQE
jgi:BASS family bile acid:Na+ symporter